MVEIAGRNLRIKYHSGGDGTAGVVLAHAVSDGISGTSEPIDASSKDSYPYRRLLNDVKSMSWQLTFKGIAAGIAQHRTLVGLFQDSTEDAALHWFSFEAPGLGTWEGEFFIASLTTTGESETASFEMTLDSSDEIAFTAAT